MTNATVLHSLHPLGQLEKFRKDPLLFLEEQASKHEERVQFRFANRTVHLLLTPALIKEVLVTQSKSFQKSNQFKELSLLIGEGLVTSEPPVHTKQRKIIQPYFTPRHIKKYVSEMIDSATEMMESWEVNHPRDISKDMMGVTLAVITKTMFDMNVNEGHEKIGVHMERVLETATKRIRSFLKPPISWPMPELKQYKASIQELKRVVEEIIQHRESRAEEKEDLLHALLHSRDEDGNCMSREQLIDEVMTIFVAGHETTANLLSWFFYMLQGNEKVKENVYKEVDRVVGKNELSSSHLPALLYTRQALEETLRLHPPVWMFGRMTVRDVEIGGHPIKKGENVLISPYIMHRSKKYFRDPFLFEPERFNRVSAEGNHPYTYLPFGGGSRVCIGNHFALQEALIIAALYVQRFNFKMSGDGKVECHPLITLRPKGGIFMEVEKR
ncbi:cytochrome P450 [Rossellomorea aquimaris]|uniref:cytochrome P450 n=1 Tax=Rossellomorea aquimaris TaxID=189382 RepID=UPI001CD6BA0F|nr:cytochrome P450 [Rossellomorea aquimaris]MCA1061011.1 cytochrome P450 [Rossellomorea aquimaris]